MLLAAAGLAARGDVGALTLGAAEVGLACGAAFPVVLTRTQAADMHIGLTWMRHDRTPAGGYVLSAA